MFDQTRDGKKRKPTQNVKKMRENNFVDMINFTIHPRGKQLGNIVFRDDKYEEFGPTPSG